jgi:hypothetical protein
MSEILIRSQSRIYDGRTEVRYESLTNKFWFVNIVDVERILNTPTYQVYISSEIRKLTNNPSLPISPKLNYYPTLKEAEHQAQSYLAKYNFKVIEDDLMCYL